MDDYQRYHFSATCQTSDFAVLYCLRSLCQWAEQHVKPQIGWGGTTKTKWKASNGQLTLRFTDPAYRQNFVDKANELLDGRWTLLGTNDDDPAERQRPPH
jgi:hypothetical protein